MKTPLEPEDFENDDHSIGCGMTLVVISALIIVGVLVWLGVAR